MIFQSVLVHVATKMLNLRNGFINFCGAKCDRAFLFCFCFVFVPCGFLDELPVFLID